MLQENLFSPHRWCEIDFVTYISLSNVSLNNTIERSAIFLVPSHVEYPFVSGRYAFLFLMIFLIYRH